MNKHLHRLVFSRRHGMLMAVAETARAGGKAASGEAGAGHTRAAAGLLCAAALATLLPPAQAQTSPPRPPVVFAGKLPALAPANNLPVANSNAGRAFVYDPARGAGSKSSSTGRFSGDLKESGAVSWAVDDGAKTATFNQGDVERVVINWDSFNIGAGYQVEFKQSSDASKYVSALNRIWSLDPSVILGSLKANREVILLNANGVYFGRGAQVDTGKFIATTNSIADAVFEKGLRNITDGSAVFSTAGSDYQATQLNAAVSVEAGAEISSAAGGDVLLIAPRVVNQGRIHTPQGQTVLAAGDKVYLMSSSDPKQRGLIVAVDPVLAADGRTPDATLGTVENAADGSSFTRPDSTGKLVTRINEIHADSGTVNLVGLSVRQSGHINATTAIKGANGAIYLQAMAATEALPGGSASEVSFGAINRGVQVESGALARFGSRLGSVEVGAGSVTAVTPSNSNATQLDAEVFNPSLVRVEGSAISVAGGAQIVAPGGRIELLASQSAQQNTLFASGANVKPADGSRIVIAPGALISAAGLEDVAVDGARNQGSQRLFRIELADAPVQRTGPLYRSQVYFDLRDASKITAANVSGAAAAIGRTAAERSTAGGSVSLLTDGALVLGDGATLDVSGGSVRYGAATLRNTLLEQDGRVLTFRSAVAGNDIAAPAGVQDRVSPAYTEGANGGSLQISGRQVALAGSLQGHTVLGERQLAGTSNAANAATLSLGQRSDNSFYIGRIELSPESTPVIAAGIFQNPLQAGLDSLGSTLDLSLQRVSQGGFGGIVLRATDISQPRYGTLDLGPRGSLDTESLRLSLNGSFSAAGGRIAATTLVASGNPDLTGEGDITVSGASRLDTAGRWTNDTVGADTGAANQAQLAGGNVTLKAGHTLTLGSGAVVDVSGGAKLSAAGSLSSGAAGSITLNSGTDANYHPVLQIAGAALRGFDFGSGGRLVLGAPELTVSNGAAEGFTLDPGFFSRGGFGNIAVNALGDVRLASGAQLAPQLLNWQVAEGYRTAVSGRMRDAVARPVVADTALVDRKPVSLAFAARRPLYVFGGADLVVERGASVQLDPGATLTLSATRNLSVGAQGGSAGQPSTLSVPGGTLSLAITGARGGDDDKVGFDATQALWLGADARLAVDGTAQLREQAGSASTQVEFLGNRNAATSSGERLTGTVLGGGTVNLNAARGYVVAETGSSISLDGTSATLNLAGQLAPVRVAKSAGTLNVSTPEGFVLDGSISARAPRDSAGDALSDGGRLNLQIGLGGVLGLAQTSGIEAIPYATDARVLSVGAYDGWLLQQGTVRGSDLSQTLGNGTGYVRTSLLLNAGLGGLALGAGDRVGFESSLKIDAPLGVQLDAPAVAAAPGVQVEIAASIAKLGDSQPRNSPAADRRALADTSANSATRLVVRADSIDVVGNLGLQGFSSVALDAGATPQGEIRFSSPNAGFGSGNTPQRDLNFAGELQLTASQVYATSGSLYTLNGLTAADAGDPGSHLVVRHGASGTAGRAPLSALASLTVNATDIDQGGTLRQPFGQIQLNAERQLTLGTGSVTSVTGEGSSLVAGITNNLTTWLPLGLANATVPPVSKGIGLRAGQIATSASAKVDAGGGGTLSAYEFFPGIGGTQDYLATPGLYAVLPDYALQQAVAFASTTVLAPEIRQFVVTLAGSGLAPGRYTLLPARFALLAGGLPQGAFLVSRAADQGKSLLRAPVRQDDGSTIITGYLSTPGSVAVGTPGERFVVEAPATYQAKSDIRVTDISSLLAERSTALGTARPALPVDAGQVQVRTSGSSGSLWQAQLDLAAAGGGQAGRLDVAALNVALLDDPARKALGNELALSAQALSASGAGSVLLGGQRTLLAGATGSTVANWALDASGTQSVRVDVGTTLVSGEELLLAASQRITLADNTQLKASGTATQGARRFSTAGDGAFLAISTNALELQRAGATTQTGELRLGAGTALTAPQLVLDASRQLQLAADAQLKAPAVALGSGTLVLGGGAATAATDTVLDGALLSAVQGVADLSLRGYDSIRFVGEQNWAQRTGADSSPGIVQQRLLLDTPLLQGQATTAGVPARTDLAAQDIVLRNSTGRDTPQDGNGNAAATGGGSLRLQALPPLRYGHTGGLDVGPGSVQLAFDSAVLESAGDITLQGRGRTTAQQDLTLSAARVTASSGASQTLMAGDTLHIGAAAGARTLGETVGVGAALALSGATVQQGGRIELPGGQLQFLAEGRRADDVALGFGAGSITSVAGFALQGRSGFTAYGTAGSVSATAGIGRIELLGTVDVSAARRADGTAAEGDAGSLRLLANGDGGTLVLARAAADGSAQTGTLLGRSGAASGDRGGRLSADLGQLASADALATAGASGGFSGAFSLRVRQGDVQLDQSVQARRIDIAADAGSLRLGTNANATLDASTAAGGLVQLAAGQDLVLGSGARIDARSTRAGANGGDVLLASSSGRVSLAAGATADAGGDDSGDGRIVLRALRSTDNRSVRVDRLDTAALKAGDVAVEAVRVYEEIGSLTATDTGDTAALAQTRVRSDNNAFMANKAGVLAALGVPAADSSSGRVSLRAGVEVRSSADLLVADDWNFNGTSGNPNLDRPGSDAGFLTLRAAGNLQFSGSLSDGFASTGSLGSNLHAWSYRLVAGADLAAANPLAVAGDAAGNIETSSLRVDAGKLLRTGAGSIEIAAGRDVVFGGGDGGPAAMAYVAGRRLTGSEAPAASLFTGQSATPVFSTQGGRLEVHAERDVVAPEAGQLVGNWLWRSGLLATSATDAGRYAANSQLAWWTQFSAFNQTLGSFGGGNLTVQAGRDLANVQAMAPTQGWADSRDTATAQLRVVNGGDLTASAGGDVLGGQFLLGRGEGRLLAGGRVAVNEQNAVLGTPVLALQDGAWRVNARSGVTVQSAFNPTAVLPAGTANRPGFSPYFYTWGADAAQRIGTNTGDLNLVAGVDGNVAATLGLSDSGSQGPFNIMPGTLVATAAAGNVDLNGVGGALMFPAATGQLKLWAGGDVLLGSASQLVMAGGSPQAWAPYTAPVSGILDNPISNSLLPNSLADRLPLTSLHAADSEPVRIHAEGSLLIRGTDRSTTTLLLPKRAELTAGQDIVDLSVRVQHLNADDLTVATAGRNYIVPQASSFELAGPGQLAITAGRDLDLGTSEGITTTGNQRNASLPAAGASVSLRAAAEGVLDNASFEARYLQPDSAGGSPRYQGYRDLLLASVRSALQQPALGYEQALAAFRTFPAIVQSALARQVLRAEFVASYLNGVVPTAMQMSEALRLGFERNKAQVLQAGEAALAAGQSLILPGRTELKDAALAAYLAELRQLAFANLDLDSTVAARVAALAQVQTGWRDTVAQSQGRSAASLEALGKQDPQDPAWTAYQAALADPANPRLADYIDRALRAEIASAGAAASQFGVKSLPMRLALYEQGFQAAELAAVGSFVAQPVWPASAAGKPVLAYSGSVDLTQSSVITERGGDIRIVNPGGAINVGLKDVAGTSGSAPKGVIALGGGDIFGYARDDFQVNTQRVFVVGQGDMTIWSSAGDIDSGRGANTAVAAPPLAARRGADGVVFETPATTTGSGLGILEDATGRRTGTIGLFPAFGEIRALDAFIRAPSVVLGSSIKGADNLQAASVGGAVAPVSAPVLAVAPPPASETRSAESTASNAAQESRPKSSLLTVELQGLGPAADETCSERDRRDNKCPALPKCSEADKVTGACK